MWGTNIITVKGKIVIQDLAHIDQAAKEFLEAIQDNKLIAFFAPMGAGKTTFTTALCRVLGVSDPVCSPTFTIVNEYLTESGESVFHFDFYRVTKNEEALDIGLYDYLDSGCLCLMEWPENIEDLLPEETLRVTIEVAPDGSRTLSW
ncbi:MAG: tRNA (adenosine(37)-N6)-threonylcarbamoyltransferase complex ATPase subunit type 1 TsaE [Bacteroidales bacterium]|nr:tRNA (adenosine(37)-N6)-threonylcarbamoyltransferase complex ATPase subunit type 1 TsaE [Bacteroidales bacterium]